MLDIKDLSKSFERKIALDGVSMSIREGEIFGLLGPNGAGKTTLIRIINRILQQDDGIVRWKGKILTDRHLQEIGYLPEERGLYRNMKVMDHLIFLGQLRNLTATEAKKNANLWLEKWEIVEWSQQRIESLSKGMAQKIQFIATVLHEPNLVILDEPLSGFDPVNISLIIGALKEMKKEGKTILLSTHNMKSVEDLCDRAALIYQSKKLAEDTIWNLREQQKTGEFSIRFKGNMIAFANALWTDFELIQREEIGVDRFVATVRMRGSNKINDLLQALMHQIQIEAVEERFPSMQDVFIQLIQGKEVQNAQ
jgi:ABC-2 type transport system ATP-binding protein